MADTEKSRYVQASEDGIRIRNAFDWAVFGVFPCSSNQVIERIGIARRRHHARPIWAPGDPFAAVLGQFIQRECAAVLEVFLHVHEISSHAVIWAVMS